jgi:hypothetical protein
MKTLSLPLSSSLLSFAFKHPYTSLLLPQENNYYHTAQWSQVLIGVGFLFDERTPSCSNGVGNIHEFESSVPSPLLKMESDSGAHVRQGIVIAQVT